MNARNPFAAITIWSANAIDAEGPENDPPLFRFDYHELREQCRAAVARREKSYPELVAAGRMDAEEADRDLAAWRELAAEWHWIITGEGTLPSRETKPARIAAVDLAADRLEAEMARGRTSEFNLYQYYLLEALHWHLQPGRQTHFLAELTRTLRAEQRATSERRAA